MIGTGEYTTGYTGAGASKSDKKKGVVALVMFDLRQRGHVGKMHLCGVNGKKFPKIRAHVDSQIKAAYPGNDYDVAMETYPADTAVDAEAYLAALAKLPKGSAVTVFTPDDTHFKITLAAVNAGMHVLLTKPAVKTLAEHLELCAAAKRNNVLVMIEMHKRWDPIYADAKNRIQALGGFSYFNSYMSQPKYQLETFRAWAGKSSDISYYLNSHHIDFHQWAVGAFARPIRVTAMASTGVAEKILDRPCEDTISLSVQWEHTDGTKGTALYTSSWVAPKADVHSQQRFFYMGHTGEVRVDQAHRGYTSSTDAGGYASNNPLYMKYTPDARGKYVGQTGYGYASLEAFTLAVQAIRSGKATPESFDGVLPTIGTTTAVTAILEAGRKSLDDGGRPYDLEYAASGTGAGAAGAGAGAGAGAAGTGWCAQATGIAKA